MQLKRVVRGHLDTNLSIALIILHALVYTITLDNESKPSSEGVLGVIVAKKQTRSGIYYQVKLIATSLVHRQLCMHLKMPYYSPARWLG